MATKTEYIKTFCAIVLLSCFTAPIHTIIILGIVGDGSIAEAVSIYKNEAEYIINEEEIEPLAAGKSIKITEANFRLNSAEIGHKTKAYIKEAAEVLKNEPYKKIVISGDSTGAKEFNGYLLIERTKMIAEEFMKNGIPAGKIECVVYSSLTPAAEDKKNVRSIEIEIIE